MQPTRTQPPRAAKDKASESSSSAADTSRPSRKKQPLLSPSKASTPQLSRSVSVTGEVERLPRAFSLERLSTLAEGPSFTKYRSPTLTPVSSQHSSPHSLFLSPLPPHGIGDMAVQTSTEAVDTNIKSETRSHSPSHDAGTSSQTAGRSGTFGTYWGSGGHESSNVAGPSGSTPSHTGAGGVSGWLGFGSASTAPAHTGAGQTAGGRMGSGGGGGGAPGGVPGGAGGGPLGGGPPGGGPPGGQPPVGGGGGGGPPGGLPPAVLGAAFQPNLYVSPTYTAEQLGKAFSQLPELVNKNGFALWQK